MWTTVRLFLAALLLGTTAGLVLALMRLSTRRLVSRPAWVIMLVFRGIPALVILYICFFGLPVVGIFLSPLRAAILGLSIWSAVYFGDIIRSGLEAIEAGQTEAAEALGMRRRYYLRRIIIPQGIRVMLPPYMTNTILLVKMTSLASTVAVLELTAAANRLVSLTFRPLEVYATIALLYMLVISLLYVVQAWLERAFALRE